MEILIKNMVCDRCMASVKEVFDQLNLPLDELQLGLAKVKRSLNPNEGNRLKEELEKRGFELLENKKEQITERIKSVIVRLIHYSEEKDNGKNLSEILSDEMGLDYKYLSSIFRDIAGLSIEKFQINHKVERVKELLEYDELSIKEIAFRLDYSSEGHLSNQFKKITGVSPTEYRRKPSTSRKALDCI